jgi:hypothetical protein
MEKPILVEWIDSCNHQGWNPRDSFQIDPNPVCFTTGIVVAENDTFLCVATSWNDQELSEVMQIPKVCIRHTKNLK